MDFTRKPLSGLFHHHLGALLIVLLATSLSLYKLTSKSLWYDEACSISFAQKEVSILFTHSYVLRPLYFLALKSWTLLFGFSEFCSRFLSVIFSILSICPLYGIGKRLFSEKIALAICLIYALSPFRIIISQQIQYYSLFVFTGVMSMYYFVAIVENDYKKPHGRYVISSLALLYTHPYGVLLIITQNIYMFLCYGKSLFNHHRWIGTQIILILASLPLLMFLQLDSVKSQYDSIPVLNQTFYPLIHTFEAFSYGGPFIGQGGSSYRISSSFLFLERVLMAFLYGTTLLGLVKHNGSDKVFKKNTFLVALWAFFPVFAAFMISFLRPALYQTRYVACCLPAFCILFIVGSIAYKRLRWITMFFLAVGMLGFLQTYYQERSSQEFASWREASSLVKAHIKEGDAILFVPAEQIVPFWYYFNSANDEPLKRIGSGRRAQVFWDGNGWQRFFYEKSHLILGVPFHEAYYQTNLEWLNTLRKISNKYFLDSDLNIWMILSPHWVGTEKAKEMIRFFEKRFTLVFRHFLYFDGIEILYFGGTAETTFPREDKLS